MEPTKQNEPKPFVTDNNNSPAYWNVDILWIVKAAGLQTNGVLSMIEQTMPYNSGPPPHLHTGMEEMFYLIEGEMTVWVAGEIKVLKPDSFCLVPRNTVHYFKITSKENCRALNIYTPAGFEEGLMENAAKAESLILPPKGLKPSPFGWRHVDVDIAPVDLMSYRSDNNT